MNVLNFEFFVDLLNYHVNAYVYCYNIHRQMSVAYSFQFGNRTTLFSAINIADDALMG